MKKIFSILLVLAMTCFATAAFAAGAVSTDGSTSMEKVIGALGEAFMETTSGVNVHLQPHRLRLRHHRPCSEGRCDIGLSSRAPEGRREGAGPDGDRRWPTTASPSSSTPPTP